MHLAVFLVRIYAPSHLHTCIHITVLLYQFRGQQTYLVRQISWTDGVIKTLLALALHACMIKLIELATQGKSYFTYRYSKYYYMIKIMERME
jgi:ribosomal protein L19